MAVIDGANRLHGWPHPLTSFVGHERETAAVDDILRRSHPRLVTLTGPGGAVSRGGATSPVVSYSSDTVTLYVMTAAFTPVEASPTATPAA